MRYHCEEVFLMITFTLPRDKWETLNENSYSFNRVDTKAFEVKLGKETVSITTSPEQFFRHGIVTEAGVSKHIYRLGSQLLDKDAITDIVIRKEDLDALTVEVQKLDTQARIIILSEDLGLICDHPEFVRISYNFLCWKPDMSGIGMKLVHPFHWRKDVDFLKANNFNLKITGAQVKKLEELEDKEGELARKAYFYKSKTGYRVLLYELHTDIIKMLTDKCKCKYNKRVKGKLEVVELTFVKAEMREEIAAEAPEDLDKINTLLTAGYRSFNAAMFTLPSVKLTFKKNKIKHEGSEKLISQYPKLDFPMKELKLWDIQQEAIDKWVEEEHLGTVALPTGSGKTYIGMAAIKKVGLKRTLVVAPTVELLFQWRREIIDKLGVPEDKVGIYYGGVKEIRDITIITFQSGQRKITEESDDFEETEMDSEEDELVQEIISLSEESALIILDEGHHAPAPVFQRIMIGVKSPYRLSLTATPYREDKNDVLAFMAMGEVIYTQNYGVLASKKYVSPINYTTELCELDANEQNAIELTAEIRTIRSEGYGYSRDKLNEKTKELKELTPDIRFYQLREEILDLPPEEDSEGNITERPTLSNIMNFAGSKFDKLIAFLKKHDGDKVIIFNQRVIGAKLIFEYIRQNGFTQSALITGSTKAEERRMALELFAKSTHGIMVTTTVLDEGIDVPDANVIIIFNASSSKRQMIQRIGRGCRFQEGKVEYVYELVASPPKDDKLERLDEILIQRALSDRKRTVLPKEFVISDWDLKRKFSIRDEELEARGQLLTERVKSAYRSIEDTVNPEEQKTLLASVKEVKRKPQTQTDWSTIIVSTASKSKNQASYTWNSAVIVPKSLCPTLAFVPKDKIIVSVDNDTLKVRKLDGDKPKRGEVTAKFTWNFAVIVPKPLREKLSFKHKDILDVAVVEGRLVITKAANGNGKEVKA